MKLKLIMLTLLKLSSVGASESLERDNDQRNLSKKEVIHKNMNPCKGITVWHEPAKEVTFSWLSYGKDYHYTHVQDTVPGEFEMTVSPDIITFNDYGKLLLGLRSYDLSHEHPSYAISFKYKNPPKNILNASLCGERAMVQFQKDRSLNMDSGWSSFQQSVVEMGGRRILSLVECDVSDLSYAHDLGEVLTKDYGFDDVGSQSSLKDGSSITAWIKELPAASSNSNNALNDWSSAPIYNEFPPFENAFGVFVRNECGQVLGGVYGHIFQNAITPHACIDVFYMDELVRGTGLGRHVMNSVETFLKEQNISTIELGTGDHQAPWFYEKIGYKKIMTYPRILQNRDGEYLNAYNYEKRI